MSYLTDENGRPLTKNGKLITAPPSGIGDATIDGESIVKDGVAEIPAHKSRQTRNNFATVAMGVDGDITAYRNSTGEIGYRYLPLNSIDLAVKAAMTDGKGAGWTVEEQAMARERMSAESSDWKLACDVTLEEDSDNVIIQLNGNYSEVYGIFKFSTVLSGEHRMMLYDNNNGTWSDIQGAFCQDVRIGERTFIHAGIYNGIAMFEHHNQTEKLAPYPTTVYRTTKECKDTLINAFATYAFTAPAGTNFKLWGRKL